MKKKTYKNPSKTQYNIQRAYTYLNYNFPEAKPRHVTKRRYNDNLRIIQNTHYEYFLLVLNPQSWQNKMKVNECI